jgi:hypothetical protein
MVVVEKVKTMILLILCVGLVQDQPARVPEIQFIPEETRTRLELGRLSQNVITLEIKVSDFKKKWKPTDSIDNFDKLKKLARKDHDEILAFREANPNEKTGKSLEDKIAKQITALTNFALRKKIVSPDFKMLDKNP